jgi:hypothetical protein
MVPPFLVATEDSMNIAKSLPALNANLAMQSLPNQKRTALSVADLFDSPLRTHHHPNLWRQARRARQEWHEQRYTRLFGG